MNTTCSQVWKLKSVTSMEVENGKMFGRGRMNDLEEIDQRV